MLISKVSLKKKNLKNFENTFEVLSKIQELINLQKEETENVNKRFVKKNKEIQSLPPNSISCT
jgi:hypothetical protein